MNLEIIRKISSGFFKGGPSGFLGFSRVVAFISVMLGAMALTVSMAILDGFDKELHKNAIRFTSHIRVQMLRRGPIYEPQEKIDNLKKNIPEITSASAIYEKEGLIRADNYIDGVLIRSFSREKDFTAISSGRNSNEFNFSSAEAKEVTISTTLANTTGLKKGDDIILYALKTNERQFFPSAGISIFKIKGIYETGFTQYDELLVFIPEQTAKKLFGMPEYSCTHIEIMLRDAEMAPAVSTRIEEMLGFPHFVLTVFELHRPMFAWIEPQKETIPIVLGIISIVAVLNIITTLLITVVEKTSSIGILSAMGMRRRDITHVFIYHGTSLGAGGALAGMAIGLLFCILQATYSFISLQGKVYFLDKLPVNPELWHYVAILTVSVLLSFFATLLPALVASRVNPINAIRFR